MTAVFREHLTGPSPDAFSCLYQAWARQECIRMPFGTRVQLANGWTHVEQVVFDVTAKKEMVMSWFEKPAIDGKGIDFLQASRGSHA